MTAANVSVAQMANTPTEVQQTGPANVAIPPTFQLFQNKVTKQSSLLKQSGDKKKKGMLKVGFSIEQNDNMNPTLDNNNTAPAVPDQILKRQSTE